MLHELIHHAGLPAFDSVRGVFWEGEELYPGAGFMEKNHIQIAIINPNCIIKDSFYQEILTLDLLYHK